MPTSSWPLVSMALPRAESPPRLMMLGSMPSWSKWPSSLPIQANGLEGLPNAEPLLAAQEFGGDRAGDRVDDRDLQSREDERQRGAELHLAEDLQGAGVERPHHADQADVDRAEADQAVDEQGKNVATATSTNLDAKPKPNQTTTSGARAILGMLWKATTNGRTRISKRRT
jgi:hypothetical protein